MLPVIGPSFEVQSSCELSKGDSIFNLSGGYMAVEHIILPKQKADGATIDWHIRVRGKA